ncbi:MAG: Rqc2 family fibronectin-binding protein [Sarcina sp.]
MALDGIFLYNLTNELKKNLIGSKIDKINQPEKDEIILTIRGKENKKLLISSSANYSRLHFTNISKQNPLKAPTFCMLMRKYLCGGKILDITQLGLDRIIEFTIETKDELGFESIYKLIIEIMGRHSNISLVRARDNKVMESIKHLNSSQNSYRVLYPGVNYVYPPKSAKINLLNFDFDDLKNFFNENKDIIFNENFFSALLTGVGKSLSKELYYKYIKIIDSELVLTLLFDFLKTESNKIFNSKENLMFLEHDLIKDFYCLNLDIYSDFEKESFENSSVLLETFYAKKDKQDRLSAKSVNIQRLVNTNIDRCLKKIKILNSTLLDCEKKESYKIKGELLTSYIYNFKKGDKNTTVLNYYNTENEEYIDITLDVNKTPSENIQKYFKRYNKLKTAQIEALHQLELANSELNYLYSVSNNLSNVENYSEIDEIKNELIESSYIRFRKNTKKKKEKISKPLHFISKECIDIYVGKNNIQNDILTLKTSDKRYTWLHTKEIPGSHVVIASFNFSDETLLEAANLAAFYSKASTSTKVPVDYTLIKNIKKPSGSKPGMVIYSTNKTLYIDPPQKITTTQIDK